MPRLVPYKFAVRKGGVQEIITLCTGATTSETSVCRVLKAHDLITSPAFIVVKVAKVFKEKNTAIHRPVLSGIKVCYAGQRYHVLSPNRAIRSRGNICDGSRNACWICLSGTSTGASEIPCYLIRRQRILLPVLPHLGETTTRIIGC